MSVYPAPDLSCAHSKLALRDAYIFEQSLKPSPGLADQRGAHVLRAGMIYRSKFGHVVTVAIGDRPIISHERPLSGFELRLLTRDQLQALFRRAKAAVIPDRE